jgi:hypothetical protein
LHSHKTKSPDPIHHLILILYLPLPPYHHQQGQNLLSLERTSTTLNAKNSTLTSTTSLWICFKKKEKKKKNDYTKEFFSFSEATWGLQLLHVFSNVSPRFHPFRCVIPRPSRRCHLSTFLLFETSSEKTFLQRQLHHLALEAEHGESVTSGIRPQRKRSSDRNCGHKQCRPSARWRSSLLRPKRPELAAEIKETDHGTENKSGTDIRVLLAGSFRRQEPPF